MPSADHLDQIRADASRLTEVARTAPEQPVAQYPGWTLRDLASHTASVFGRTTIICETLPQNRISAPRLPEGKDPIDWHEETSLGMLAALESIDPETPAWALGASGVVGFWADRMLVEAAIHRWDAEQSLGDPAPLAPPVVASGLDEITDLWLPCLGEVPPLVVAPVEQTRIWTYLGDSSAHRVAGPGSDILLRLHSRGGFDGFPIEWETAVDALAPPPKR